MTNESTVLMRAGAILALVWMARAGVIKAGHLDQSAAPGSNTRLADGQLDLDEEAVPSGEVSRPVTARGSNSSRMPVISSVSPSTLPAGAASTVRINGTRLSGAFVTGSRGMLVTSVQVEIDTLIVEIFVDAAATPGPATLTLLTGAGAITVPVTIAPGNVPVIAAGHGETRSPPRSR